MLLYKKLLLMTFGTTLVFVIRNVRCYRYVKKPYLLRDVQDKSSRYWLFAETMVIVNT